MTKYVDLSGHNVPASQISWSSYKTWSSSGDGIPRFCCKVSEGAGVTDPNYAGYVSSAKSNGIRIIHYHYARPDLGNTAQQEAQYFINVVGSIGPDDQLMLDYEGDLNNNPTGFTSQWAYDWLSIVSAHHGRQACIYSFLSFIQGQLQDSRLVPFPLIFADPTDNPDNRPSCPAPWTKYIAVQYSWSATVPGIPGTVDADVWIGGVMQEIPVVFNSTSFTEFYNGLQSGCGAAAVTTVAFGSKNDGVTPSYQPVSDIQNWYYNLYVNRRDVNDPNDAFSNSINDMRGYFEATRTKPAYESMASPLRLVDTEFAPGALNYANIVTALEKGYPVVVTVTEGSIFDLDLNQATCQFHENHILVIAGIDSQSGGYLCFDTCPNPAIQWPRRYDKSLSFPGYGAMVQLPWLPPVPGNDPSKWSQPVQNPVPPDALKQFANIWAYGALNVPANSKIARAVSAYQAMGKMPAVYAVEPEQDTVSWDGTPIKWQSLSNGDHAEYNTKDTHVRLYDNRGHLYFDYA